MKLIEDYLKKDLRRNELDGWDEIRCAYLERATELIKNDWQSPSYLASGRSQAGRREGKIIGNINDYTRDQHDLSLVYEKKFCQEYLPRTLIFPIEPFVTSSGMAALSTIIFMLHREHGVDNTVLVGKHSYFQNLELLIKSFTNVILFDESNEMVWKDLILNQQPLAVFVDSLCNESGLTIPPVFDIAEYISKKLKKKGYIVVDNSMLSIGFPWKKLLKMTSKNLTLVGWESLNKYYEFGLDRTTGGVMWGSNIKTRAGLSIARRHAGTIMSDLSVAMLPTPNKKIMQRYLDKIEQNRRLMMEAIGNMVTCAKTNYDFSGAQLVVTPHKLLSYDGMQRLIKRIISKAKGEKVQLVAGTSFGMPSTRIYLTAKQTDFAQMFLRISVGTEDSEEVLKLGKIIASSL